MVSGRLFYYVFACEESMWWKLPASWWYHENVGKGSFLSRPSSSSSYGEYLPDGLGYIIDSEVLVSLWMTTQGCGEGDKNGSFLFLFSFETGSCYRLAWNLFCRPGWPQTWWSSWFCWVAMIIGMSCYTQPSIFIEGNWNDNGHFWMGELYPEQ